MAISSRNKVSVNFSSVGMTDVVFNLLIFFMLTSTLVHPTETLAIQPLTSGRPELRNKSPPCKPKSATPRPVSASGPTTELYMYLLTNHPSNNY